MDEMFGRLTASRRRQQIVGDTVACGLPLNESLATARHCHVQDKSPAFEKAGLRCSHLSNVEL
jgi:hypothetical protein